MKLSLNESVATNPLDDNMNSSPSHDNEESKLSRRDSIPV